MFVKEFSFIDVYVNDVCFSTDGVVLRRYNEINDGYDYKVIANVAVVYIVGEDGPRIYGSAPEDGLDVWSNNKDELVGWSDSPIPIKIINEASRFDDIVKSDTPVISDGISGEGVIIGSYALVLYQDMPTLYVKYEAFNEASFKEVTSIVSKLYL